MTLSTMTNDPPGIVARIQGILDRHGAAAWADVGRMLANPEALAGCRAARARFTLRGMPYGVNAIVPLNAAFTEAETIRLRDADGTPDIYYGMTNGRGRKSHADHAVFHRARALTARFVTFGEKDNAHDLFTGDGRLLVHDSSWLDMLSPSPLNPYVAPDHGFGVFALPEAGLAIRQPCLFIGGQTSHYHFTIDHLPLLLLARDIDELAGLPVVLHRFGPAQAELCRCFGFDPARVVALDRHAGGALFTAALEAPTIPAKLPLPLSVTVLRRHLGLPGRGRRGKRRIFLGRRADPGIAVRLANQTDVASALSLHGFETVFTETMPVTEQRALFADAEIVVASHGAGLTNLIFAPSETVVVELMSDVCHADDHGIYECYRKIAAIIGQPYYRLVCPGLPADGARAPQDVPFHCDPRRLDALLPVALDADGGRRAGPGGIPGGPTFA